MLDKISLSNFKSFSKLGDLDVKPITILCGVNSCGKSSILQSILLWKQTLESKNVSQSLLLNGRLVHLGSFKNLVHKHKEGEAVKFDFTYRFSLEDAFSQSSRYQGAPIEFLLMDFMPQEHARNMKLDYVIKYSVNILPISAIEPSSFSRNVTFDHVSLEVDAITPDGKTIEGLRSRLIRNGDTYTMEWENYIDRHRSSIPKSGKLNELQVNFVNLMPSDFTIEKETKVNLKMREVSYVFYRMNHVLRYIHNSFTYLGPLREEPARRYIYEDEIVEIGTKGENAAYIYLAEQNKYLRDHWYYDTAEDKFTKENYKPLRNAVDEWLKIMGIANFDAESSSEIIRLLLDSSCSDSTKVNIADVGFGVSQIFPIVLEGLRMDTAQTLLLEQPEIHLHPKLQMQLADYLISLALSKKRAIVETHSDHIINRLVRRIVEDEEHKLADLIAIYFVNQNEEGSYITAIQIDELCGIVNWPKGFFDQTAMEQQKIMQAGIKKRKARRGAQ